MAYSISFTEYITNIKSMLECNIDEVDIISSFGFFPFTEKQIDDSLDYFKECYDNHVSSNTALEQFYYELK